MLYNNDIPRRCGHCVHARPGPAGSMVCPYKGPVQKEHSCRRYRYDALKRIPPRAPAAPTPAPPTPFSLDGDD